MSVLRFNTSVDESDLHLCKALIILTLRKVGTPECAIKVPASLLDVYQDNDCTGRLTTWTLAAFALEHERRIETWTRNGQLYLRFSSEYSRDLRMNELGAVLTNRAESDPGHGDQQITRDCGDSNRHPGDSDEPEMWRRMWEVAFP